MRAMYLLSDSAKDAFIDEFYALIKIYLQMLTKNQMLRIPSEQ